jgi:methylenetetrahydrofolate--tRNA-(uracil-5-)-methyltransferase
VSTLSVVGGGLAGCEAAWFAAHAGCDVRLYEMRPVCGTAAHQTDQLAELVCSNSFRNNSNDTAVGLLKDEMRHLGSLTMRSADMHAVPAGAALAVDRDRFAAEVSAAVAAHPRIAIAREEVSSIPDGVVIIATGPLTSPALSRALQERLGQQHLYFYDAIAPIVTADSIDRSIAFSASRYGKGGDDYLNCPFARDEYYAFVDAVLAADKVPARDFERCVYFEGCMPIEEMARRGPDTLAFGPMRPVGLTDPRTGKRPFAVAQARQDDAAATLYNLVGFQTKMTYTAQRRVLRMIPGLAAAEFVRLGSLHRNTFINSPSVLRPTLQLRSAPSVFLAGQLIGVEGYVESAASGIVAGLNAARLLSDQPLLVPPPSTALGSLIAYVTDPARRDFQPMNANYGLFPAMPTRARGRARRAELGARAVHDAEAWMGAHGLSVVGRQSSVVGLPTDRAAELDSASSGRS